MLISLLFFFTKKRYLKGLRWFSEFSCPAHLIMCNLPNLYKTEKEINQFLLINFRPPLGFWCDVTMDFEGHSVVYDYRFYDKFNVISIVSGSYNFFDDVEEEGSPFAERMFKKLNGKFNEMQFDSYEEMVKYFDSHHSEKYKFMDYLMSFIDKSHFLFDLSLKFKKNKLRFDIDMYFFEHSLYEYDNYLNALDKFYVAIEKYIALNLDPFNCDYVVFGPDSLIDWDEI